MYRLHLSEQISLQVFRDLEREPEPRSERTLLEARLRAMPSSAPDRSDAPESPDDT